MALNLLDLKAFGERIAARHQDSQTAEIQIRIALTNRLNALGTAEIIRVARSRTGKSCLRRELLNVIPPAVPDRGSRDQDLLAGAGLTAPLAACQLSDQPSWAATSSDMSKL